jgi:hypothetical protein
MTPTDLPMIDIGTQTAETGPSILPRSLGQASMSSLCANS